MNGFLVRVTYLEQQQYGRHNLMVQGIGRFSASKVYKEVDELQEEVKAQEPQDLWIGEGQLLTDVNRFDLIAGSGENAEEIERLRREYKTALQESCTRLMVLYREKFEEKLKSEAKLRGNGGIREEAALKANIYATFGSCSEDIYRRLFAANTPGTIPISDEALHDLAEQQSLYTMSNLEF